MQAVESLLQTLGKFAQELTPEERALMQAMIDREALFDEDEERILAALEQKKPRLRILKD